MALAIHILLVLIGLLLAVVGCCLHGHKPSVRKVLGSLGVAFLSGMYPYIDINMILEPEGNSSPLPLLLGGCIWLVASLLSGRKQVKLCVVLFLLFLGLDIQHKCLVATPQYTDNPSARQNVIYEYNHWAAKEGKPLSPPVQSHAHWYTRLTGLYTVEPPTDIHPHRGE